MAATVELDKVYTGQMSTWGTIQIRVVVVKPKEKDDSNATVEDLSGEADEPLTSTGTSPLSGYLERAAHGRHCVVFLVNGQRHDACRYPEWRKQLHHFYDPFPTVEHYRESVVGILRPSR